MADVTRGALLIGVENAAGLPRLRDAVDGAKRMQRWAESQGMKTLLLTDETRPVTAHDVKERVKELVQQNLDQLVVYYAGHGIVVGLNEYWLLSAAGQDPNEAVNVDGSVALARMSVVPHVVLLSDACRTAAQSMSMHLVRGQEIFRPAMTISGLENPVDLFFACSLGRPAHEIRDPSGTTGYSAVYSAALLEALEGTASEVLESDDTGSRLVRPRPLKAFLFRRVMKLLKEWKVDPDIYQVPDARITSDPTAWLSRIAGGDRARAVPVYPPEAVGGGQAVPETLEDASRELIDDALHPKRGAHVPPLQTSRASRQLAEDANAAATQFGPDHFETRCGFKVRGTRVIDAAARHRHELLDDGRLVRVDGAPLGASALLEFENGHSTLLPIIPDFIGALTWNEGRLVDVSYEPSANSTRYPGDASAASVRRLRAIAAASARSGVFRLEGRQALEVARLMQKSKGNAPALAVYAAYAYHDMMETERLREMDGYLRADLGASIFDVALLARKISGRAQGVIGLHPLLMQGWGLLSAFGVTLPRPLADARNNLVPSLWTLFDGGATPRLREALMRGDIE